ncbi:hypothetical protein E1I18_01630 [Mycoplasmopsis mucosicanis]|uniref:DUF31 domain-containing protein n=1 Tax=Mycoplasmopsis mucosicanis TaxID=458208 RepID=A0A507SQI2_9BACT|nr:hypothetical protein [Mycoplasmopsis mucosicanis]TQC51588.1 hypothetical protein E1I18_01630 [Mycoplasmopsis mucosicanis]
MKKIFSLVSIPLVLLPAASCSILNLHNNSLASKRAKLYMEAKQLLNRILDQNTQKSVLYAKLNNAILTINQLNEILSEARNILDHQTKNSHPKNSIPWTPLIPGLKNKNDLPPSIDNEDNKIEKHESPLIPLEDSKPVYPLTPLEKAKHVIPWTPLENAKRHKKPQSNPSKLLRHTFSLESIYNKAKNEFIDANSIVTSTPFYVKTLEEFKTNLKNHLGKTKYLEYVSKVGIYGDYGSTPDEKLDYFYDGYNKDYMMKASFLDSFDEDILNSVTQIETSSEIVNKLNNFIEINPFGFLPSNLSQLLNYIDLNDLSNHFGFDKQLVEIKANSDDKKGSVKLLFKFNDNTQKWVLLDKNNSKLRCNKEFFQYIYDRTFSLGWSADITKKDGFGRPDPGWRTKVSGTAWLVDRVGKGPKIKGPNEMEDQYEFLVATNAHVVAFGDVYDRSIFYNDLIGYKNKDQFVGKLHSNFDFGKYNYEFENGKPIHDYSKYLLKEATSHLGTSALTQYLDMIYYTPRFTSKSVRAFRNNTTFMDKVYNESTRIGEVRNSGADFAIIKLRFTKKNIKELFPTLYEVFGTNKEKDWYVGLGNENKDTKDHETPIKTHFVLGYPDRKLNAFRSQGGYIETQNRIVDNDRKGKNEFNRLWVRYNKEENEDWNRLRNWYKEYEKPFVSEATHGMAKDILQQMSTIYFDNEDGISLIGGSSGSMVIDSRFNVVGINFKHVEQIDSNNKGNQAVLFKGYSDYDPMEFSGDIKQELLQKLKRENLETIKLNPKKV